MLVALPALMLAFTLNNTLLNPQFMISETAKLDIPAAVQDILTEQLPPEDSFYLPGINTTLTELKPWITENTGFVIRGGYAYLQGVHRHPGYICFYPPATAKPLP